MSQNKILITGALGFLGSCFVRIYSYGKAVKYDFAGIDKVNSLSSLNNTYVSPKFKFHIGDLLDKHCIDRIFEFEKPDYVLHAASISEHTAGQTDDVQHLLTNNIIGTQNIIDLCVKHKVKRLIFMSSDEVYRGIKTKDRISEVANLNPNTLDGIIKLSQELLIKVAGNTHGLNYNIIRPCSIYGNRQPANQFIPKTISCIMNKQNIYTNGGAGQVREWCYITDVCNGIMKLIESEQCNDVWNITANHDISNIELIQKICNLMDGGWDLIKDEVLYKNVDEQAHISMNAEKIKGLGWTQNINIPDGLRYTIEWYQKNKFFLQ